MIDRDGHVQYIIALLLASSSKEGTSLLLEAGKQRRRVHCFLSQLDQVSLPSQVYTSCRVEVRT